MAWIPRAELPDLPTVSDFMQMLKVFDDESVTEFQYIEQDNHWKVFLK